MISTVTVSNSQSPFDFSKFFIIDTKDEYCTLLSSDRILVFSMSNSLFKLIRESKRQQNDVDENGPNQWVKFITKENIAYGTSKGAFFLFNIKSNKCKEIRTGFTVTDVFVNSVETKICICTVGPKIVLISETGDSIESIPFEAQTNIVKNISFCGNNYYFCCCANLYKSGKQEMLEQKNPEVLCEGIIMMKSNDKTIAVCDVNGSIYQIDSADEKSEKVKVGEAACGVMFIEVTNKGVLYVDWSGEIHRNGKTIEKKEIINSMFITYDSLNDRLLFLRGHDLGFVPLDTLVEDETKEKVEEIKTEQNEEPTANEEEKHENQSEPVKEDNEDENMAHEEELNSTIIEEHKQETNNTITEEEKAEEEEKRIEKEEKVQSDAKEEEEKQAKDEDDKPKQQENKEDKISFVNLSDEEKIKSLITMKKEDIMQLAESERDSLLSIKGKEEIIDRLIETNQWIRASVTADALDVSLNERIEKFPALKETPFEDCVKSIEADMNNWKNETMQLKLLAFAFNMSELPKWSLASFLLVGDFGKVRVLLSDDRSLFEDSLEFTRDYPSSKVTEILRSLNLGF